MENYQKKYEEYVEKIKELKSISLEETGLFSSDQDVVIGALHKNYIYNVGSLLEKYSVNIFESMDISAQLSGIINLLRHKYLGENFPCMSLLNKQIMSKEAIKNMFLSLGFGQKFACNARLFYYDNGERVIDFLKRISSSEALKLFDPEDVRKIAIIEKWYDKKTSYDFSENVRLEDTENIRLEDIDILTPGKNLDSVYVRLKKNNITNLQDIFLKDAEQTINYGNKGYNYVNFQTYGTVKLLRCKYLNEDLPFIDILDGEINKNGGPIYIKKASEREPKDITACEYLCRMGLSFQFACDMQEYMKHQETVICFLERLLANKNAFRSFCKKSEYERNIKKLEIIIGWYNLRDIKEEDLGELQQNRNELIRYHIELKKLQQKRNEIDEQIAIVSEKIQKVKADELMLLRKKQNN